MSKNNKNKHAYKKGQAARRKEKVRQGIPINTTPDERSSTSARQLARRRGPGKALREKLAAEAAAAAEAEGLGGNAGDGEEQVKEEDEVEEEEGKEKEKKVEDDTLTRRRPSPPGLAEPKLLLWILNKGLAHLGASPTPPSPPLAPRSPAPPSPTSPSSPATPTSA
jgi:hypothetical protein